MNKLTQNLFQVIYPFYPFWAYLMVNFVHFPHDKVLIFLLLPILIYNVWHLQMRVPTYLVFYIMFTLFHLGTVYSNNLIPSNTNWFNYFFSDTNVLACVLFLVIENTNFEDKFIQRMNRNLLIVIVISLIVSIIQIKYITFFYHIDDDVNEYLTYYDDKRAMSIYSWTGLNSVGISFPIMVSILLAVNDFKSKSFAITILSGIVVSFLTRARYVMISVILAFSQLIFIKAIPVKKKFAFVVALFVGMTLLISVSQMVGYDINKTINERILEKGNDMGSAKTRLLSYEVFMIKFPEHPYFGVGPKTRADVIDLLGGEALLIHVGYLSYLYYYGIFGAGLLFIALFFLIRDAWLVGKRSHFWGSFYGFLGFAVANVTFVYFAFHEMGIILAVIYMRYYNVNDERLLD